MKKKVYIPWALTGNDSDWIDNTETTNKIEEADIIVFTGGADISPELYGYKRHPKTYFYNQRDLLEVEAFNKIRTNQLVIGICRGAQLVTALNGGKLIQHVENHNRGSHNICTPSGNNTIKITSLHHQMMYPFDMSEENYTILYETEVPLSCGTYLGDKVGIPPCEPEVVLYHVPGHPVCLAIQGHPEMMNKESDAVKTLNEIIKDLL